MPTDSKRSSLKSSPATPSTRRFLRGSGAGPKCSVRSSAAVCLILFAWSARADAPLFVAANRDEFFDRPAAPAAFWEEPKGLLAGRDLSAGGTWLGVTTSGRFAAITNYRDPLARKTVAPSRGALVVDFLAGETAAEPYLRSVAPRAGEFNGFSMLAGDRSGLYFFSNREGAVKPVEPGVHGLSNHLLDTP